MRICVIGEGMLELSAANGAWRLGHGGDTLNTAIHLARCGRTVQYFTALGSDQFSEDLKAAWAKEGIDLRLILTDAERLPGLYAITTDAHGERSFSYWRSKSAAGRMFALPSSPDAVDAAAKADVIAFSLISLAILPVAARDELIELCKLARTNGARIVFDGNYRPRLWRDANEARQWRDKAVAVCDIGLPTLADEALLRDQPSLSAEDVARMWGADAGREIVVKLGAEGCLLPNGARSPAPPVSGVVDTSGAGDAFNAGYLHARLSGGAPEQAAQDAHRLAGWVIRRSGAIPARDADAPYS